MAYIYSEEWPLFIKLSETLSKNGLTTINKRVIPALLIYVLLSYVLLETDKL